MNNKLLITQKEEHILTAWQEEGRICRFQFDSEQNTEILGNIYVGKVRNIVKNINAAFVEFKKGQMGYLSLQESFIPLHTDAVTRQDNRVLIGDEIIVQVAKEAVKTKPPTLSGRIDLAGQYVVLCSGTTKISVSHKIKEKENRERILSVLQQMAAQYQDDTQNACSFGFIARTNSASVSEDLLLKEAENLITRFHEIVQFGRHKSQFSCLYQAPAGYLSSIQDLRQDTYQEIITDCEGIYQKIIEFLAENHWEKHFEVTLWDEENGKLDAVFDISKNLERALRQKVWLKSGAYLVIQPTEALVSIDVNTGKAISKKKDVQKTFLKVNKEAAAEIAVQLRLRNLSGIILIDFIDMQREEDNQELLAFFRKELAKDSVPSIVVDMTKLGLVEMTRKKVRKSLQEQLYDKGENR